MDLLKKIIKYFIVCIVTIIIISLFFIACYNHNYTNSNIQKNIDSLSVNIENIKANIKIITNNMPHECTREKDMESIFKEFDLLFTDVEKAKDEIVKQYRTIFDANTITFLVTFLSALFFTLFLTYLIYDAKLYGTLKSMNDKLENNVKEANYKIAEANDRVAESDTKIKEVNAKIAIARKDWDIKQKYLEYLLKLATERNNLTQILNLVSVLGSQLASSNYNIKPEYAILVYMIHRKTQLVLKEGFKDIKDIRSEDKAEFMQIITDCITYLNIETLTENNEVGLKTFTQLYNDLKDIRKKIENMQSRK